MKAGSFGPGTQVSVKGHEGRFRILRMPEHNKDGSFLVWGPVTGRSAAKASVRSFQAAQITKIHKDLEKETCPQMPPARR